jgi:hypothetical protein
MAIVFLPSQPDKTAELMLSIDAKLVAAVDKWRAERAPDLDSAEAVETLLRAALATEGFFDPENQERKNVLLAAFFEAANGKLD